LDYNMSLIYSPKIVTDGLVLCLDAKQNSSFPSITLPVKDGLILWLDAADDNVFNYSSGTTNVSQWRDKSGLNNHVNQTNITYQPERSTSTNGKKTILFSSDYLITDSNILKAYTSYTKIAVVKQTSNSTGNIIGKSTGANTTFWYSGSNNIRLYHNSTTILTSSIATTLNTWNILSGSFDSVSLNANIYVNGSSGGSATSPTVTQITTDSDVEIGGFGGAANYFTGEISEILIFNRVLSTTELKQVHTYLGQKWGISNNDKIWCDLSGNNHVCSLYGSPSWDGLKFAFPDNQITVYAVLPVNALNGLTSGTIYTLELITSFDNTNSEYFFSCATAANNNLFIIFKSTILQPFAATQGLGTPTPIAAGETMHLMITNNSGTVSIYKNGEFTCSWTGSVCDNDLKTTEGWVLNQEQDSVLGGFDPTQCAAMKTSVIRLYDKVLSAQEIKQNFNATRSRFGL